MIRFLARWVAGETLTENDQGSTSKASLSKSVNHEVVTPVPSNIENDSSQKSKEGMTWPEWKARELNRVFEEQGVTRTSGRITAETARLDNKNKSGQELRKKAEKGGFLLNPAHSSGDDPTVTAATHQVTGLLAIAYQRHATIQQSRIDSRKDQAAHDRSRAS